LVVLVLVAACSSGGSSTVARSATSATSGPAPATKVATHVVPQGSTYVALGSSFAAGPGIPVQAASCGRSDHNYPNLAAASLGLVLVDVSCSGATTANVLDTPEGPNAPQIDAVTPITKLVTVTIGGNDIEYSAAALECANAPGAADCTGHLDSTRIDREVAALPGRLDAVLAAIARRAPNADVVVVTYPRVVPAHPGSCPALGLAPADARFVGHLGQELEDALVGAAARAHVAVADPYVLAAGHGPCAPNDERWVEGARPQSPGYPFHPNANGHREMASLVQDVLHRA
jgi:lysophospholipase L1-like esterase